MRVAGADPGMTGGLAVVGDGPPVARPMPIAGREIDWGEVARILRSWAPDLVCIEKVNAGAFGGGGQRKAGAVSMFRFGGAYTGLRAACSALGLPYDLVTPQRWKAAVLVGTDRSKAAAVEYVTRRFPDVNLLATPRSRKPHEGMAEAVCIAQWGVEAALGGGPPAEST